MSFEHFLSVLGKILEDLNVCYFVTGGFAVCVWGRPRTTFDLDLVIVMNQADVNPFIQSMRNIDESIYVDEQMIRSEIDRKGEFNIIHPNSGLKVDFFVKKDDELSRTQMARRIEKKINGQTIYFISPEDLIISKLIWAKKSGSNRQLDDAQSVFEIMKNELDSQYINEWLKRLGLEKLLKSIQ